MSVIGAALITLLSFGLLCTHLRPHWLRRIAGYAMWFDIIVHCTVIYLFMGTSTLGLMQAELSAIMFTVALRAYRWLFGFEKLRGLRWVRYSGKLTKHQER